MRLSYDARRNVAYPAPPLQAGGRDAPDQRRDQCRSRHGDTVAGIELPNANEQLRASDEGQLIATDEADGREVKWR